MLVGEGLYFILCVWCVVFGIDVLWVIDGLFVEICELVCGFWLW